MIDHTVFSLNIWDVYQKEGKEAFANGNLSEAERDFAQALEKAEQFGSNDPRIATSKRHLAEVKHKQGQSDEAEKLYKEAIDLLVRELGQESVALVKTLTSYKSMLDDLGKSTESAAVMERLKRIRKHAVSVGNTTDLFTIAIPTDPESQPMTDEQEKRIRELLTQVGVSSDLAAKVRTQLEKTQNFLWAHQIQGELRKAIVDDDRAK